jgi:NACHT domain
MRRRWDLRQRLLFLVPGVLLIFGTALHYWKAGGLAIAAILSMLLAAYQVLQGLLPGSEAVDAAAINLRDLVERNWGIRRRLLLGESEPADVDFVLADEKRLGLASGGLPRGQLTGIYGYYARLVPERLVILGRPGSGKTLLAIELALRLLEAGRRNDKLEPHVAVPVGVAGWTGEASLDDWLIDRLSEAYHLQPTIAAKLVESNRILPVLDGLDEIAQDPNRGMATVEHVLLSLNSSVRGRALTPVVITCRDDFYRDLTAAGIGVRDATVVMIEPLDARRISSYIEQRFLADAISRDANHEWERVRDDLRRGGESVLLTAFAVPWLLALATTACEAGPTTLAELKVYGDQTQLRRFLIREFIPATVKLHPKDVTSKHLGDRDLTEIYSRTDAAARYDPARVTAWLTVMAGHLCWQRQHGMSPTDLLPYQLWRIAETGSRRVRAVHTTIAVVAGLVEGCLGAEFADGPLGVIITCLTAAAGAALGLRAGLWKDPLPSRVNIRQAFTRPLPLGLVIAASISAGIAGTIDGGVLVGLTEGIAAGLGTCVLTGLSHGTAHAVTPAEALTNDLIFGLVLGGILGVATGLPGGLTGGLVTSLRLNVHITKPGSAVLAITISIIAGIGLGARAWLRYIIALAFLAPHERMPWKPQRFLDWASIAGLLRVSGIAYQFRHDELREYLTPPAESPSAATHGGSFWASLASMVRQLQRSVTSR